MKTIKIIVMNIMVLCSFYSSANIVQKLYYILPTPLLMQRMFIQKSIKLPEMKLFNKQGELLKMVSGDHRNFSVQLLNAFTAQSEGGKNYLLNTLAGSIDNHGDLFSKSILVKTSFVLVEYWADWCKVCEKQREQVQQYIKTNNYQVLWVTLNVDPKRLTKEGFNVSISETP